MRLGFGKSKFSNPSMDMQFKFPFSLWSSLGLVSNLLPHKINVKIKYGRRDTTLGSLEEAGINIRNKTVK